MKMHRFSIVFVSALAALLSFTSCRDLSSLTISSCKVSSIIPAEEGFDAGLSVRVNNPGKKIVLSEISGTIYMKDSPMAGFTADDVTVEPKCLDTCILKVHLKPDPGQTIMSFLKLRRMSVDDFTFDVQAKVKYGRTPRKRFALEGAKVRDYINGI